MPENIQTIEAVWTWGSILKLSITTGVATALMNQGLSWIKETAQRRETDRRAGTLLALTLVEIFTNYAQECSARVRSNLWDESIGDYGSPEIPALPAYNEADSAWAIIPSKLAGAIRDFKHEYNDAILAVRENDIVNGPPDAINSATSRNIQLGYKAWRLATRLRRHYAFCAYSGPSDFADQLGKDFHKNNPTYIRRIWRSYPVYRARTFLRRKMRQVRQRG